MKKSILIFLLAVIPASTYASIEEPIQLQAGQISGTLLDNGVQSFFGGALCCSASWRPSLATPSACSSLVWNKENGSKRTRLYARKKH